VAHAGVIGIVCDLGEPIEKGAVLVKVVERIGDVIIVEAKLGDLQGVLDLVVADLLGITCGLHNVSA
jgi:hypothetical protein